MRSEAGADSYFSSRHIVSNQGEQQGQPCSAVATPTASSSSSALHPCCVGAVTLDQ